MVKEVNVSKNKIHSGRILAETVFDEPQKKNAKKPPAAKPPEMWFAS